MRTVFGKKTLYAGVASAMFAGGATAGVVTSDGADIVIKTQSGFEAATTDGQFKFKVDGRLQLDFDSFDGIYNDGDTNADAWDTEIRRARVGFSGTAYQDWHYNVVVNLVGSGAAAGDLLDHAYIEYTGFDFADISIGRFKPPIGLEVLTSSKWITTIERSSMFEMTSADGIAKRIGIGINGNLADQFTWAYSAFDSQFDEPDNTPTGASTEGSILEHTARLTWSPIHESDQVVHLGVAHAWRDLEGNAVTNLVDTEFGIHLAKDDFRTDGDAVFDDTTTIFEAAYLIGPFSLQGEFMDREVDVRNVAGTVRSDLQIDGYYLQGAWTVTGESRSYKWKDGKFDKIKPKGEHGAIELVAKFEDYMVDFDIPAAANDEVDIKILTLGVNWYVNQAVKMSLNYVDAEADGMSTLPAAAGTAYSVGGMTDISGTEEDGKAVTARIQYVF